MLALTRELCALSGVSSREEQVRNRIAELLRPWVNWMKVDAMGNLIAFKEGKKPTGSKLLLDAHMDEVGVMVTGYTSDGYLRFDFVGGVDRRVVIGKRVYLGEERILGVFGMKPIHQTTKEERKSIPKVENLYIDIGAENETEARSKVKLGEVGVFDGETLLFGDGFLKGKAIDDRAGCAALVKLAQEELPMDVTFTFTTQEEVGTRGAFASAFSVKPEIVLTLEATTAADLPGTPCGKRVCSPGKGVVIPYMDGGTIYDRKLFEQLRSLAEENGIPWQTKEYLSGGTNGRVYQRSRAGVRVAGLAIATRYLHAPTSVAATADLDGMLNLARMMIGKIAEEG